MLPTYLQVAPLILVLVPFFVVPVALVLVVSFFRYQMLVGIVPDFTLKNYVDLLQQSDDLDALPVDAEIHADRARRSPSCSASGSPISWSSTSATCLTRDRAVPGLHGAVLDVEHHPHDLLAAGARQGGADQQRAARRPGVIDQPLEWLLFSDFSVVVAYVHLFTLFMIVPIFNSMARIDKSLLEAAVDAGATRWGVIWNVVLPLSKTGIALGALFVVTLVMGDFFVVTVMSGGGSGSVSGLQRTSQFLNIRAPRPVR